jgi:hypothetical protein
MNNPNYSRYYTFDGNVRYGKVQTILKADIPKFVSMLHAAQFDYLEEAVQKSDLKEANQVIKHVMNLKPDGK